MINVTKTFLPDYKEYEKYLMEAWDASWLTNRGSLVLKLEDRLKSFLDVPYLTLTSNGTLPIQMAIQLYGNNGEIITTPFSYIATTSSILWQNCKPIFVDIDRHCLSIDENKIEALITSRTTAILATHVFGNPCNVEKIEAIALKYNLKVIYDAAHCFGVKYKGKSLLNYGDISTCSFHATKLFHTGEGGCWVTKEEEVNRKLYQAHNFGHKGPNVFEGLGINAKMSELHAAMGLACLDRIDFILGKRKELLLYYLEKIKNSNIETIKIREHTEWNYHYMPVIFKSEEELLKALQRLNSEKIYPRRYFYPSLNTLDIVRYQKCEVSEDITKRIICLPLSTSLEYKDIDLIISLL